jgi:hypothetical protein
LGRLYYGNRRYHSQPSRLAIQRQRLHYGNYLDHGHAFDRRTSGSGGGRTGERGHRHHLRRERSRHLQRTTKQGNFNFTSQEVPFGTSKSFLGGRALVEETAAPLQLTSSEEEEDFPSIAQSGAESGDDVYLAYTEFVHGDRSLAVGQTTTQTITNFRTPDLVP